MNLMVGLWLIFGLVLCLFIARRAAVARRKRKLKRHIERRRTPRAPQRVTSERADMRAYEDPSTFARDITTTGSSGGETPSGKKSVKNQ
ncbi:MAG TPA: hypothetical protein VEN29_09320 [Casimicrobiaceae bacterium]|nr:hypothetical protein [Casimicrobiaceae bacterium]